MAGSRFDIAQLDARQARWLRRRFAPWSSKQLGRADFAIKVCRATKGAFRRFEPGCVAPSMGLGFLPDQVQVAGLFMVGQLRRGTSAAQRLTMEIALPPGDERQTLWAVENALRMALAYRVAQCGGVVVHSAAARMNDEALLFFGHSGVGKTTLASRLDAAGAEVLSDDLNIILPHAGRYWVTQLPLAGVWGRDRVVAAPVPLRGIFRLRQGPAPLVEAFRPAAAVAALLGCAPYVNGDAWWRPHVMTTLESVANVVPMHQLTLALDNDPARLVGWAA